MHLLLTRPEPDAGRTAQALRALGHTVTISPLMRFRPLPDVRLPKRRYQAVLVTSTNAVRALLDHRERTLFADCPLLAVGDRTALMARRAGFAKARSAGGSVDDLVALVGSTCQPGAGPLLYLAGQARTGDLEGRLAEIGFSVDLWVVYDMEDAGGLSETAIGALRAGEIDGVLIYSQQTAAAFALALRAAGLAPLSGVHAFCLSEAASRPLATVFDGPVHIAEKPDQVHLFATVDAVFRA
ncbi:MAG: uroporphyrinogen-III synthase [Hyphomicrobiales bacterium]|nr:uroporphyrinogen-III synthase [Hyphomicrobiales bacterium]